MSRDVFLSYAAASRAHADAVCAGLEARGLRCWVAPRDIPAGADYPEAIANAIDEARVLILLFTDHCNQSAHVLREVERAVNRKLPIINFRLQDTPLNKSLDYLIKVSQWLDAVRGPTEPSLDQLAQAVTCVLQGQSVDQAIASTIQQPLKRGESEAARGGGHEQPGDFIGPYKLLEVIGEGGFGEVWLAEQREPIQRRVALKIIKPGMDTKAVIARFEQERQALAVMDHPGVAKVLDAGSTSNGRPFFVMEYIKGEPLTTYCDRHKLSVKDRLILFAKVCDAVHHAHMKGLIHRDLKPSNILVTIPSTGTDIATPRPVVIDFGVAKAIAVRLTEKTIFTEHGALIGTPEYMSPEQAEMVETDIDTRTDIYALGVILYELLTGSLPFDSRTLRAAGYAAIQRMIREVDPPKPSTRLSTLGEGGAEVAAVRRARLDELATQLRRELEWIPLKALRKDRAERYRSAAELADDVTNYLANKPLIAGPESTGYRMRKFVRRNKGAVAAAAALLLALLLGLGGTLWQARRADERAEGWRLAKIDAQEKKAEADAARIAADNARAGEVKAREIAERQSYVANIERAAAWMDLRQFHRVRQRLAACPERLRNWEWGWLDARADNSLFLLKGHEAKVLMVAYSPDGTRIATASADKTARVWDSATGASMAQLRGHTNTVTSVAFSPDGTRIVTTSDDKTVRVWDAATGASVAELREHTDTINSVAFSPDGTRIVTSSSDYIVRVRDSATGRSVVELVGHTKEINFAEFSPDGTRIVTASADRSARVWDAATGAVMAELEGHTNEVNSAAFSPDGTQILTMAYDTARVWDVATGQRVSEFKGNNDELWSAVFNTDGTRVLSVVGGYRAVVWDAATGEAVVDLASHTDSVTSAAYSPDGTRIVTASADRTALVWDVATGASLSQLKGHTSEISSAMFSPDGTRIVTTSRDGTARVWDAATGVSAAELDGDTNWIFSAAFSTDGTQIVVVPLDMSARVLNAATGAIIAEFKRHTSWVHTAVFSPDGTRVVTASSDKTAWLWDATTGTDVTELRGHSDRVTSAKFSPDGTRVVTASSDKTARVWEAATGANVAELKGHSDSVTSAVFSPLGARIVTTSKDGTARVWDAATGTTVAELKGHGETVSSAAFSPDGTQIVTTSTYGAARVWDATTGASLSKLQGHTRPINSAQFSPEGSRIVTASEDNTAQVWDAATGTSLAELQGHVDGVLSAAFNPDGTRIVTASRDKTARVWDAGLVTVWRS